MTLVRNASTSRSLIARLFPSVSSLDLSFLDISMFCLCCKCVCLLLVPSVRAWASRGLGSGGYTNENVPFVHYSRSKELFLRWTEFGAFSLVCVSAMTWIGCACIDMPAFAQVFRTHPGSQPSLNWQFNSDPETIEFFCRFATVFEAWKFYRVDLMRDAAEKGNTENFACPRK